MHCTYKVPSWISGISNQEGSRVAGARKDEGSPLDKLDPTAWTNESLYGTFLQCSYLSYRATKNVKLEKTGLNLWQWSIIASSILFDYCFNNSTHSNLILPHDYFLWSPSILPLMQFFGLEFLPRALVTTLNVSVPWQLFKALLEAQLCHEPQDFNANCVQFYVLQSLRACHLPQTSDWRILGQRERVGHACSYLKRANTHMQLKTERAVNQDQAVSDRCSWEWEGVAEAAFTKKSWAM